MRASRRKVLSVVLGGLFLVALSATAGMARDPSAATVTLGSSAVVIQPGPVSNFAGMTVQIVDSTGQLVLDARSEGEAVVWAPAPGAPDGQYRYEAVVVTWDPSAPDTGSENNPSGVATRRRTGSFLVSGGVLMAPRSGERGRR